MTDQAEVVKQKSHPAKFHPDVLKAIRKMVLDDKVDRDVGVYHILDPMAGVGGVHALASAGIVTYGIELEKEWADQHPDTIQGDCLKVMQTWVQPSFDAVVVSPVYGNRMSDHHEAKDASKRNTYRHILGRPLSDNSSAAMHFTDDPSDRYKDFHRRAWRLAVDLIKPGGIFVLNTKDFFATVVKGGIPVQMRDTEWHLHTLLALGLELESAQKVVTPGNRQGKNGTLRMDHETVSRLRKPA